MAVLAKRKKITCCKDLPDETEFVQIQAPSYTDEQMAKINAAFMEAMSGMYNTPMPSFTAIKAGSTKFNIKVKK